MNVKQTLHYIRLVAGKIPQVDVLGSDSYKIVLEIPQNPHLNPF